VRRAELEAWGFGECRCERCVEEEAMISKASEEVVEKEDLEKELKVGLGMM